MEKESLKETLNSIFTKEDIEFNKKMVEMGRKILPKRPRLMFSKKRDYDFSSEVLNHFREKWGITKNE